MLLHRGEDERILKCFCILDMERREGLYVITSGTLCYNKRNATGLVCGSLTGFECFIACDCVNSLDFLFEKGEVVSTIVKVFDEFIGA